MSGPAGFAAEQLRSFVERLERLEEEIAAINDDKKSVYAEAKGTGFDVKIIREVLKIRRQDKSEREEREAVLDLYLQALGMSLGPADPDDEPAPRAPARTSFNSSTGRFETGQDDLTIRVEAGGKSAEMPLSSFNKIVDGSRTETGRAAIAAAVAHVKHGTDAEVPFA